MSDYIKNLWNTFYLNTVDMVLTQDLTFTTFRASASGISPNQLLDPIAGSGFTPGQLNFGWALNMRASGNSLIYKYNLPSGTIVRAAMVKPQEFKIVDYRLPDSGFLPLKNNQALNFFPSVIADTSSQIVVLSLPSSSGSGWIGQTFTVKKIDTSINSVFLSGINGDRIDGQFTYEITHPFESVQVQSNGSGWYIIG